MTTLHSLLLLTLLAGDPLTAGDHNRKLQVDEQERTYLVHIPANYDHDTPTPVVPLEIEGGGHTWPGQKSPIKFLGKSTLDISANNLIWEFFQKHPMK